MSIWDHRLCKMKVEMGVVLHSNVFTTLKLSDFYLSSLYSLNLHKFSNDRSRFSYRGFDRQVFDGHTRFMGLNVNFVSKQKVTLYL